MRDGVRTLIKLDSPDRPASSASQPKAGESTKPAAQQGKKPLPAPLHAKRQAAADKGARSAGQGLGIKSGGGVTKAAPEKLKKVMKKGKLPEFSFDSRSIFINRKAAASKPQPGALPQKKDRPATAPPSSSLASAAPATNKDKENRSANTSSLSLAHAKAAGASAKPGAATNKGPGAPPAAMRRQSVRGVVAGGAGAAAGGEVPKRAQVTEFAVAQAPSGRKRNSSAEAYLPAGLPCFVT